MADNFEQLNEKARTGALIVIHIVQSMLDRDETDREINRARSASYSIYALSFLTVIAWVSVAIYFHWYEQIAFAIVIPISISIVVFFLTSLIDATLMNKFLELNHEVLNLQTQRSSLGLTGDDVSKSITEVYEKMRYKPGGIMPTGGGNPIVMFSDCEDEIMQKLLKRLD